MNYGGMSQMSTPCFLEKIGNNPLVNFLTDQWRVIKLADSDLIM